MEKYFNINSEKFNVSCKIYCDDIKSIHTAVLFGHGFGGHKDNKAAERFAKRVLEKNKNIAVFTFNWPCHGDDVRQKLQLDDCMTYLDLVISYVRNSLNAEKIYAYATSFGAYLFLKYIADNGSPFEKLAFRCPAVDMYHVITKAIMKDDELDRILQGKTVLVGFDRKIKVTKSFLDDLTSSDIQNNDYIDLADDMLILQGTADEVVEFSSAKAFAENNVINFIPVEGADHRFKDLNKLKYANSEVIQFFGLK